MLRSSRILFAAVLACLAGIPASANETAIVSSELPDGFCADYPQYSCSCAHANLPIGENLRVTWDGVTIVCQIYRRGPHPSTGVDLALSRSAARRLGLRTSGRTNVFIEPVGPME